MSKLLWIAIAGGLGSALRVVTASYAQRTVGGAFPVGTMTVNLVGCFLFGLLWALVAERGWLPEEMKVVVFGGFLGGFTTFSAYGFELADLMAEGKIAWALGSAAIQNLGGVLAVIGGSALGRL